MTTAHLAALIEEARRLQAAARAERAATAAAYGLTTEK